MIYSLRSLLISLIIILVVVLLIVLRTFSTLRSQEKEQERIIQSRKALQILGPAIINMQDFEFVTSAHIKQRNGEFSQQFNVAAHKLKDDSIAMTDLAVTNPDRSSAYLELAVLTGKMTSSAAGKSGQPADTTDASRMSLVKQFKNIAAQLEEENRQSLNNSYTESISLTRKTFAFARVISGLLVFILVISFWFIYRDIKARKKAEEKLQQFNTELEKQVTEQTTVIRQNEEKYRSLFASMTDAYAQTDMSGTLTGFNPAFRDLLGYTDKEVFDLSYKDITPSKWHGPEHEIIQKQVLKRGFSDVYEKEYRHKNGRIFPVELRTFLLKDDAGHPLSMWAIVRDISARKEAEAKLEAYGKNLHYALSSTTDVFYVTDKDCRLTLFNEAAAKNLKIRWGKELSPGANVLDLIPEKNYEEIKERFESVMGGKRIEYELFQHEKELPPWVLVTFTPIADESGKIIGATVTGKDISERKNVEEMLRRSEQQLLASIENTPNVAVQWYNEKGEILFWNKASEFIFGWKSPEAVGNTLDKLIFNDQEHGRFFSMLGEVARTGTTIGPVEFSFKNKNNKYGSCISTIFSIPSIDGEQNFACMDVDITAQKQTETELREAEAKFRKLVEQSLVGVYIIQDERFVYVNPGFAEIFGYTEEEVSSNPSVYNVIHPDDRSRVMENVRARISGEIDSVQYEANGLRRDGELIQIEVFGSRTEYSGRPAIIGTILDITDRKKAEKEKERARYLLNERVKELSVLYRVSQAFQREKKSESELLQEIVLILPSGWQYPAITAARIVLGDLEVKTPNYGTAYHRQASTFPVPGGQAGTIEVIYLEQKPPESEDAFLTEERNLINMLSEMLRINLFRRHEAEMNHRMEQEIMNQKIQEQKTVTRAILNAEERERNKIGRELHDNVNQILASVKLFVSMAADKELVEDAELLHKSVGLLDNAIAEIRSLSQSQVTPLRDIDLKDSIQTLVDSLNASTSIRAAFTFEKNRTIADELKLNIYRLIQEQVSNILKHANASEVTIGVNTDKDFLHLVISDNGKGFDTGVKRKGIGISNMINRVESYNGALKIDSSPGNGCKIEIRLPCREV